MRSALIRYWPSDQMPHCSFARPVVRRFWTGRRERKETVKEIGNADRQMKGHRLNNRAEDSHQPFRQRDRATVLAKWRHLCAA